MLLIKEKTDKDAFSVRYRTRKAVRNRTLLGKSVRKHPKKLQIAIRNRNHNTN